MIPDHTPLRSHFSATAHTLRRLTEHHFLLPLVAAIVLVIIWGATANLIHVERTSAERTAAGSTLDLLETYEAQMVRNLREIDQTLKIVKFAYERRGASVLGDLKRMELLPPELLFAISVQDTYGALVASTRGDGAGAALNREEVRRHSKTDELRITRSHAPGASRVAFSRRLNASGGEFAGVVSISVDAAYFVSVYDRARLGDNGVLGLLGMDGKFLVRRTGEATVPFDAAVHPSLIPADDAVPSVELLPNAWDGVERYTSVRPLFSFPLVLVVGLSRHEQLAATRETRESYLWRAALGSALLLAFIAALARVSWQLAQAARRETASKAAHAERVQHLAYHDNLTGLPNRFFFSKVLEQGIAGARRHGKSLAVLFLDLDRFKEINDTLGHQSGDQLLEELARRLQSCVRESDTVARLGGDEFVVVLPELDDQSYAATVARKLLGVTAQPFEIHGRSLIATASIGIAMYPRDGYDEQALMKCADAAMYHAKAEGKDNFQYYAKQLQADKLARLTLEVSLRHALERNEFELHYQPKIDLLTGGITGVEALLRWRSPEHGMVMPGDFIPIAEYTGLIVPIGRWVLETACTQGVAWKKQGFSDLCISVNLSPRQFSDAGLVSDIAAILARTGIDPATVELEITESMLMQNVDRALRTLAELTEMRLRLAVDDFGTGYSSLSNLKRFPLNTLKIDRAFIRDLPHDGDDRVIAHAIIGMGRALSLTIVAEGVETAAQVAFLRDHRCDQYQGYHFSKPIPAADMTKLLQAQPEPCVTIQPLTRAAQAT